MLVNRCLALYFNKENDTGLLKYIQHVGRISIDMGIPSISEEDGLVFQAVTSTYASLREKEPLLVLDLGAGVGYSTLWLVLGLIPYCETRKCSIVAVERDPSLAQYARELLYKAPIEPSLLSITVATSDAIEYLGSLNNCSVDIAFIDIDKGQYLKALRLLVYKLKPRGIALFHNALLPRPPKEFFQEAFKKPWRSTIIPTRLGILEAVNMVASCLST